MIETLPFGGHPVQLILAIGLALTLAASGWDRARVGSAAARLSFVLGAGWMLLSGEDKHWYPAGQAIAALATWAVTGWLCGFIVWSIVSRIPRLSARTSPPGPPIPEPDESR